LGLKWLGHLVEERLGLTVLVILGGLIALAVGYVNDVPKLMWAGGGTAGALVLMVILGTLYEE
jgi:hypothetical protein